MQMNMAGVGVLNDIRQSFLHDAIQNHAEICREALSQAEPRACSTTHLSPKRSMKKLKTIAFGGLTALTLIALPLTMTHLSARADGMDSDRGGHALEQLNLSANQTSQIEAIRADTKSQMQAVLTPEQQTAAAANGGHGWRQLNLSDAQRSQMRSIHEAAPLKLKLTPC